jgi:hypothetical protein
VLAIATLDEILRGYLERRDVREALQLARKRLLNDAA